MNADMQILKSYLDRLVPEVWERSLTFDLGDGATARFIAGESEYFLRIKATNGIIIDLDFTRGIIISASGIGIFSALEPEALGSNARVHIARFVRRLDQVRKKWSESKKQKLERLFAELESTALNEPLPRVANCAANDSDSLQFASIQS